jgi:hypothetical protein
MDMDMDNCDMVVKTIGESIVDYITALRKLRYGLDGVDEVCITDTPERNNKRAMYLMNNYPDFVVWLESGGWKLTLRRLGAPKE